MERAEAIKKTFDYLMDCGVFYYATVDEDGKAHVRPFGFADILEDGNLYFGMGSYKRSYKETEKNPYVEICACKGTEWLRIRGKAVFNFEANEQLFVKPQHAFLKAKYGPDSELTHAPFYLEDMEIDFNDKTGRCDKWL